MRLKFAWLAVMAAATCASPAMAQETITVTATRVPEPADSVPSYVTVISGEDLRARHVTDLRSALALVAGVEAPPGGDAGPASAVPSFWGLHEFDAFLLVVDGVPLGGAFNPAIPDLDLNDVERIEVLKGSAPVLYGAASFVGVIQVIHYPAGKAENRLWVDGGNHGSWRAGASFALSRPGGIDQSLTISAKRDGYSDPRDHIGSAKLLYRAGADVGGGRLRFDFDYSALRSVPSSPVELEGTALTILTPLDANYNPTDARIDEDRAHGVLGYSHATPLGVWETTISLSAAHIADVRGFLRTDLVNADSQRQHRHILDDYADTHVTTPLSAGATLVWGADLLYGRARQASFNGGYTPDLLGRTPLPATTDLNVDEINRVYDKRVLAGQYIQLDWEIGERLDVNGGLRLNETHERKQSTHIDGFDASADTFDDRARNVTRLSGAIGASFKAWSSGKDEAVIYAQYKNAFKQAAIDFGPDNTPDILKPETAQTYELGLKGHLASGRLDYEVGLFQLDFENLVVVTTDAEGDQIFQNAGGERLRGVEAEAHWRVSPDLRLAVSGSYHDAKFTNYVAAEGAANIDVSGNQLTLSPHWLGAFGLIWQPASGPFANATVNYVGPRFLDLANTARVGGYATADATVGYRFGRYSVSVSGTNLTDQRPPVTASEFGDQSYYLLPGRKVYVDFTAQF